MTMNNDMVVRFAVMFHDTGKAETRTTDENGVDHFIGHADVSARITRSIMERMHQSNDFIDAVVVCVQHHGINIVPTPRRVRRVISIVGEENFMNVVRVKIADDMAKDINREDVQQRIRNARESVAIFNEIIASRQVFTAKNIAVNGHDMMAIGFRGREIGDIIQTMVDMAIDMPETNTHDIMTQVACAVFPDVENAR